MTFPPPTKENEMKTLNERSLQELSALIYAWHDDADTSGELIAYINNKSQYLPPIPLQVRDFDVTFHFSVTFDKEVELPTNAQDMTTSELQALCQEEIDDFIYGLENVPGYPSASLNDVEVNW